MQVADVAAERLQVEERAKEQLCQELNLLVRCLQLGTIHEDIWVVLANQRKPSPVGLCLGSRDNLAHGLSVLQSLRRTVHPESPPVR